MARILYFDCFSGISGDMALGAMLDAGLPLEELRRALGSLAIPDVEVSAETVLRAGVSSTKFALRERALEHAHQRSPGRTDERGRNSQEMGHTHAHGGRFHDGHDHAHGHEPGAHPHRTLEEIYGLVDTSGLTPAGRDRAKAMFRRLGEAEAAIHGVPIEQVHLHEVGALDSIIDIVGIVYAMEWARADRIVCSPLNVGGGMVTSAHGVFPVPAPATVKLLGAAPIYGGAAQKELVTPTGALIVSTFADSYGPIPAMRVDHVGYGAGDRDDPITPNVVRVLIGDAASAPGFERVSVVECEIDDMNPQIFGAVMEKLYTAGALDVFYVSVQMKKNRPGTLLTVIAPPDRRRAVADLIFRETTSIGLRYSEVERECLAREFVSVETPIGSVRVKVARRDGRIVNALPEFEDCARLASASGLSIKDVQALAVSAYGRRHEAPRAEDSRS